MPKKTSTEPFLMELLITSYSWFVRELNLALDSSGEVKLTRAQIILLYYLENGKDRAQSLSHKMGLSRQAISLTVRELEKSGVIKLIPDPNNKKAKLIKKTAKGRKSLERAFNELNVLEEKIVKRIGRRNLNEMKKNLSADWG